MDDREAINRQAQTVGTDTHTFLGVIKMKTLVLLLLGAIVVQAQDQAERSSVYTCRAYSDALFSGTYQDFTEAVPYLGNYNFDNTIESVKVTGVWLFYDNPEYNTHVAGLMHYSWGIDYQDPLTDSMNNRASSLRYAGNQMMMNEEGFNVYQGTYFTGMDLYGSGDIPDLTAYHQPVSSIIIIGGSSWTFCDNTNYSGSCVCLAANLYDLVVNDRLDVGFYPSIHDAPVGLYRVLSVRKGCF